MSIMHIFSIAEGTHAGFHRSTQFRSHTGIPWDEAYELYLDPDRLMALVSLARSAQGDDSVGLRGRVFDVMREVLATLPVGSMARRDHGPYALVTPSSVWTRIELEQYLLELSAAEWTRAYQTGQLLVRLAQGIKERS